jgi:nuclear pore complex protein Nup205
LNKKFNEEFQQVLLFLNGLNQRQELLAVHAETLRSWSQLVIVTIEQCDFDGSTRTSFALQILQLILPKLEHALEGYDATSLWTARTLLQLVQVLMKHVGIDSKIDTRTDFGNDKAFSVFRIALVGVYADIANAELRSLCYSICYQYLSSTLRNSKKGSVANRHILRSVKVSGERLLDVACDDAYSGEGQSRIAAVMLLDALVLLSNVESSKNILEGFGRLNFVGVLVDGVKSMPRQIQGAEGKSLIFNLSCCRLNCANDLRPQMPKPLSPTTMRLSYCYSVLRKTATAPRHSSTQVCSHQFAPRPSSPRIQISASTSTTLPP